MDDILNMKIGYYSYYGLSCDTCGDHVFTEEYSDSCTLGELIEAIKAHKGGCRSEGMPI